MNAWFSSSLRAAADAWAEWMWQMSWQVLVLVAILSLMTWAWRRKSARLRHALWLLVLLRLVLPPDTAFPTGFGWWISPLVLHHRIAPWLQPSMSGSSATEVSSRMPETSVVEGDAVPLPISWSMILFLLWCGVIAVRLGMLVSGWIQIRKWISSAQPLDTIELQQALRDAQQKVGWHGPVDLRNSEACATPMVIGLWRPVILLPSTILERLTSAELSAVLVHELTHLRRQDGWTRTVQALIETLYFFHPAIWWSSRQLCRLREDACDEASIAALRCRKAYGSALIKAAEILGYAPPPLALGILDAHRPMVERVHRLLDPNLPLGPIANARYGAVLAVTALILLPAGLRPKSEPADVATIDRPEKSLPPVVPSSSSVEETKPLPVAEPESAPLLEREIARSIDRLADPAVRDLAVSELQSIGSRAESAVIGLISQADTNTRVAAYEVLGVIGLRSARDVLETAFLKRSGAEQFAARRALEAVVSRVRSDAEPADGTNSIRYIARQE